MRAVLLCALAVRCAISATGAQTNSATNKVTCTDPDRDVARDYYYKAFDYVEDICIRQLGEQPVQPHSHFPVSYRNPRCALAMNETADPCIAYLETEPEGGVLSTALKEWRTQWNYSKEYISNSTKACPGGPECNWLPVNNEPKTAPSVCGMTLVNGDVTGEPNSEGSLILRAPGDLTLQLDFTTLVLPENVKLTIKDGEDSHGNQLALYTDCKLGPSSNRECKGGKQVVASNGSTLFIEHVYSNTNRLGQKGPVGLPVTFSADISCHCSDTSQCGTHRISDGTDSPNGECKDGMCVCNPGFTGDKCEHDVCDALHCNEPHGICHAGACYCTG